MNRYRETHAEINLKNLYKNYQAISEINTGKTIIPVVKANAYGHGAVAVTEYLISKGVMLFAVSLLEEAIELRKHFKDIEILIMGVVNSNGFDAASDGNFILTISNNDQIESLKQYDKKLTVHIKIDTGMNRLGFKENDVIYRAVRELWSMTHITVDGIYTHFATADSDETYYLKQRRRFYEVINMLDYKFDRVHVSNSSSAIKYERDIDYTTHARVGISLYGLSLDEGMEFLENTYKLKTKISEIKKLCKGEKVGYGATYEALDEEVIGILPVGYADGFIRKNQGGYVEINNQLYPIVGRICMDQMFIKIDEQISKNEEVVLMGGMVSIDDVANRLETINYEVICQITYRVPKVYIK